MKSDNRRLPNVRLGIQLQIKIAGVEKQLKSNLVGMVPDEYVIIQGPKMQGIETKLFLGNEIRVIFLSFGTVYGFNASILNYVTSPARLIILSFPEEVEKIELRKDARVDRYLPATASVRGREEELSGMILDISPRDFMKMTKSCWTKFKTT